LPENSFFTSVFFGLTVFPQMREPEHASHCEYSKKNIDAPEKSGKAFLLSHAGRSPPFWHKESVRRFLFNESTCKYFEKNI